LVLIGLLAILALYDDFKTFQEGGESFFNWTVALGFVHGITQAFDGLIDTIKNLLTFFRDFFQLFYQLGSGNWSAAFEKFKALGQDLIGIFSGLFSILKGTVGQIIGIGDIATNLIGSLTGHGGLPTGGGIERTAFGNAVHLGASGGSNVSQRVNQETNIHIQGSADANAVGKAVAGEQGKVNFDLVRNMAKVAQ
jgi:hypothetical protein